MKATKTERADALDTLRRMFPPGSTYYTVLRHVSKSGMMRVIGSVAITDAGPLHPNFAAAAVTGWPMDQKRDGLRVSGCGMDMGFHLAYTVSRILYPDGFGCIGENCRSNDHSNGDRDRTPHPGCGTPDKRGHRDHWHRDGGYALRHAWL